MQTDLLCIISVAAIVVNIEVGINKRILLIFSGMSRCARHKTGSMRISKVTNETLAIEKHVLYICTI